MPEQDAGRSQRLFDEMLQDARGAGEQPAGSPVLPRLRLTLPNAAAPLSIKRKAAAQAPLPAAQLLPEILRQVEQARQARSEARARAMSKAAAPRPAGPWPQAPQAPAAPAEAPSPARRAPLYSRVAWRYALVFGKRVDRIFTGHNLPPDMALEAGEQSTLFGEGGALRRRVPSHFWEGATLTSWAFLAPALVCFLLFSWLPLFRGLLSSFQHVSLTGDSTWVGMDHYVRALGDPQVWATLVHALTFCGLSLALGFWMPLLLALYGNELKRGQGLLKLVFFLPFLTPAVPAVLLWRWILDQGYGLFNSLLSLLPIADPHVPWLNRPWLAMLSVVVVFLWKNTGWNALIYMTSLRELPEELYETAELDGTNLWQRVRHVSLPYLRPTIIFLVLMQVISTLQIFTEVYLLTDGGPVNSTEMIATYMYKRSFLYLDIGYAAALGVMLFMALLGFTAARLRAMEEA
jgi:multiple sugar transport system permease protein